MIKYTPYCYVLGWSKLSKYYYGVRHARNHFCIYDTGCHPDDLLISYPTSSKVVRTLIKEIGDPDIKQIRKTFSDAESAVRWESRVLKRLDVLHNDMWLNKSNNKSMIISREDCSKRSKGKMNGRYQAFIVSAEYKGSVSTYTFDGPSPVMDAKKFGLTAAKQSLLKQGGEWIVSEKGTRSRSRHPFKKGTRVTVALINS